MRNEWKKFIEPGNIYGELKVIKEVIPIIKKDNSKRRMILCECLICGSAGPVTISHLETGHTTNCRMFDNRYVDRFDHIEVFIHGNGSFLLDKDTYFSLENKRFYIDGYGYPMQGYKAGRIKIHRYAISITDKTKQVDHINRNRRDCRRSNLRIVEPCQNSWNMSKRKTGTKSVFKGVYIDRPNSQPYSKIMKNGFLHRLGYFNNEKEAAKAYDKKAIELFGEHACTNKMLGLL